MVLIVLVFFFEFGLTVDHPLGWLLVCRDFRWPGRSSPPSGASLTARYQRGGGQGGDGW